MQEWKLAPYLRGKSSGMTSIFYFIASFTVENHATFLGLTRRVSASKWFLCKDECNCDVVKRIQIVNIPQVLANLLLILPQSGKNSSFNFVLSTISMKSIAKKELTGQGNNQFVDKVDQSNMNFWIFFIGKVYFT